MTPEEFAKQCAILQQGSLPGELGLSWEAIDHGWAEGSVAVEPRHMAPNGYLHAAAIIALADTACGFGCIRSLPEGATSFTTVELKSNFIGTAGAGEVVGCAARLAHAGRQTQVWDAEVVNRTSGKTIALFRCTQMILYPR